MVGKKPIKINNMDNNYNLNGCWIINVPALKYGYSFAVYIGDCEADEQEVIDKAYERDLFESGLEAKIADAVKMDDDDYDYWANEILDISK